jgi:hypothetical protein
MVEAASREAADIRIYCDNDISSVMGGDANSRWVPCPDELHPGGPYGDGRLNSGLDFEEQVFWDQVNTMYRRVSTHGVQDPDADGEETLAQTYRSRVDLVGSNENPNRETMTVSQYYLHFFNAIFLAKHTTDRR